VRSDQVTQIRGYADQLLRVKNNPYDPSNRRITILVKNAANGAAPDLGGTKGMAGSSPGPGAQPAAAAAPTASKPPAAKK
jgi:chemotaxis protein MotB